MHFRISSTAFLILLATILAGCRTDRTSDRPSPVSRGQSPPGLELTEPAAEVPGRLLLSVRGSVWYLSQGRWTRVTRAATDTQAAWDRTGKRVYFVRRRGDYSDLYVTTSGWKPHRLLANRGRGRPGSRAYALSASWALQPSPARGQGVVVLTDRGGFMRVAELWPGKSMRTLASKEGSVADPQVSPDGKRLAYVDHSKGPGRLMVVNLVGRSITKTVARFKLGGKFPLKQPETLRHRDLPPDQGIYDPAWSADSKRLYFVASTNGSSDLYEAALGSKPVKLADGEAVRQPVVTVSGSIAYLKRDGDRWQLWTARVSSSKGKRTLKDEQQLSEGQGLDPDSNLSWHR